MSKIKNHKSKYLIMLIVPAVLAALFTYVACAQVGALPSPPPAPQDPSAASVTITGTVAQINYSREYQPESVRLNDGQIIDFPPHLNCALAGGAIKVGDSITVTGNSGTSPSGTTSIHAEAVANKTSGQTLSSQPSEPLAASVSGSVSQLNYGRGGEVNGVILDTNELVLFPPHVASSLNLAVGSTFMASGYERILSGSRKVMDAQNINHIAIDAPPPPKRP
jgi:hypothetical protein